MQRSRDRAEQIPSPPASLPARDADADPIRALQRAVGNRALAREVAARRTLARDDGLLSLQPPQVCSPGDITERKVDEQVSETISHAPTQYAQWNGTYSWKAKWTLRLDKTPGLPQLEVVVKLHSTATADQKKAWTKAITSKWSGKFDFCVLKEDPEVTKRSIRNDVSERYPIHIRIDWVAKAEDADYVVRANTAGATEGGRAGKGGTTSMTGWGVGDLEDITHEFGHMLGCPEEYFTTDGVDFTEGGKKTGFRDLGGGVMNNPAGPALARNFAFISKHAAALRGVPVSRTRVE
jgi:hypothetical protein